MKQGKITLLITATLLAAAAVIVFSGYSISKAKALEADTSGYIESSSSLEDIELGSLSFKGVVDSIGAESYVVSGVEFRIDALTIISGGPVVGDMVKVKSFVLPDSTRYALKIEKVDNSFDTAKFEFEGIVETMGSALWTVSGQDVTVNPDTMIDPAIAVGSFVEIEGFVDAGVMIADEIKLQGELSEEEGTEIEFYGMIESVAEGGYVINGLTVNTDESTEIKGDLAVGDLVKVEGWLNADGTVLAHEIKPAFAPTGRPDDKDKGDDDQDEDEIKMIGSVESISDTLWIVAGTGFLVDDSTKIEGDPAIGDTVKIEATIQADGTYLAKEIELENHDEDSDDRDSDDDGDDDDQNDHDDDDEDDYDDDDHDDDNDDDDDLDMVGRDHDDDHDDD